MVSGEKRNCEGGNTSEKTAAILLDIEGTTTSIDFVKETLFGYVRDNLEAYIDSHWNDDEFKEDLKALKLLGKKDEEDKVENFCPIEDGENEKESLVKNVLWQMDLDRKTTALKQLQGHIWREGYEKGKLKGQVYSDVPQVLKKWCEDDRKLYIYSSGSVEAQKLLFKNSEAGDLEAYITGHFDTEIGQKTDASSYANIAKAVGFDAKQILFLTDSVKEAVAADKAGLQVTIVIREGNAPLTDDEKKAFNVVTSLKDLVFESCNKKKKICEEEQDLKENSKAENVENSDGVTLQTEEIKNGKTEKMEVEVNEEKRDSSLNCSAENLEGKTEGEEKVSSQPDKKEEQLDLDNVEAGESDKQEESVDAKPEEVASNGKPETKDAEEGKEEVENSSGTEPVPVASGKAADEIVESSGEKSTEKSTEPEMAATEEGIESNEEVKNLNGHEKKESEMEEANGGEKTCDEVNGKTEADDKKIENNEISESVTLKKMDEQADSAVEVTA